MAKQRIVRIRPRSFRRVISTRRSERTHIPRTQNFSDIFNKNRVLATRKGEKEKEREKGRKRKKKKKRESFVNKV